MSISKHGRLLRRKDRWWKSLIELFVLTTFNCFVSKHCLSLFLQRKDEAMSTNLTKKQLGQKIAALRKQKDLSQEDLAQMIKISRPSLAQIELGNRSIDIIELKQFSMVLGFSLDEFMSSTEADTAHKKVQKSNAKNKPAQRFPAPKLKPDKFRQVLLYMLERCAGKPNVGETVLYKLLYFADFNYYELYEEHMTGAAYRKLPYGPVPHNLQEIINNMIEEQQLKRIKVPYFENIQTRYIPLVNSDLKMLNGAEKDVIDKVIEQYSDWSANAISNYSHRDMPWQATKEGAIINYELVFYREAPYSVRNYGDENV